MTWEYELVMAEYESLFGGQLVSVLSQGSQCYSGLCLILNT